MSLFAGPKDQITFQPRGDDGPTFYLRQALVRDRGLMVEAVGKPRIGFWERIWALKAAVDRMAASGEFEAEWDQWKELIELYSEHIQEAANVSLRENTEEAREAFNRTLQPPAALDAIIDHVRNADPIFDRLLRKADAWRINFGTEAARHFLVGWKGAGLPKFKRDPSGVTEACLRQVLEFDLISIGDRVQEMLEPTPDKVGNSVSASLPRSSPTISGHSKNTDQPKRRRGRPRKPAAVAHSNGQISVDPPIIPAD